MGTTFEPGKPLYLQLEEHLRTDIVAGRYKPYDKLPGVRDLALEAQVNPNTMQRALSDLEQEGLILTRGTSGRFVSGDESLILDARRSILLRLADEYIRRCGELGVGREEAAQIIQTKEKD